MTVISCNDLRAKFNNKYSVTFPGERNAHVVASPEANTPAGNPAFVAPIEYPSAICGAPAARLPAAYPPLTIP